MDYKNQYGKGGRQNTWSFSTSGWLGNWIQLGLTRSTPRAQVKVYLNGDLLEPFSVAPRVQNVSHNGWWIGADQKPLGGSWDASYFYDSSIDDISIIYRAFSAEEVKALYNFGQWSLNWAY